MKDIAIYGFGGFGREIACVIRAINESHPVWNIIGYFDDGVASGTRNKYGEVLGGLDALNGYGDDLSVAMAIASPVILKKLTENIRNPHISFPNLIAPNVFFFDRDTVEMGTGNVITFGGRISCHFSAGNFNLINGCTSFGHDVKIGNYNVLQPETRISGECTIGDGNFFGARSMVLQGIRIGNDTRIGAGSVVMRKTKDHYLYLGNPAKRIEQ